MSQKPVDDFNSVAQKAQELLKIFKENLKNIQTPIMNATLLSDLRVLEICVEVIENQQKQDKKIAELEARLNQIDKPVITKLDKPDLSGPN